MPRPPYRPTLLRLEPRFMFDAAAVAVANELQAEAAQAAVADLPDDLRNESNRPPIAQDALIDAPVDVPKRGTVLDYVSDPDGDSLIVSAFAVDGTTYRPGETATMEDTGTVLVEQDGTYTFSPEFGFNGESPPVTFTVDDSNGASDEGTLTFVVYPPLAAPPNDGSETVTTTSDTLLQGNLLENASDPNGTPLSVAVFTVDGQMHWPNEPAKIAGGTLTIGANGDFTFDPDPGFTGPVPSIEYTVLNAINGVTTSTLTITVSAAVGNNPPVDANDRSITPAIQPVSGNVLLNASDADADPLTVADFTIIGKRYQPGQTATIAGVGAVRLSADGSFWFSPEPTFNGPVPVAYTVTDGQGDVDTSTLTINVTPGASWVRGPSAPGADQGANPQAAPAWIVSPGFNGQVKAIGQAFANGRDRLHHAFGAIGLR